MSKTARAEPSFTVHPLTPSRWADVEKLFGPEKGANSGCWCMWPRLTGVDFRAMGRKKRKSAFRSCVKTGPAPGLLLYEEGQAIGWVAVSPRAHVTRFEKAKVSRLEPGKTPAKHYAITCFYVRTGHRKRGLMTDLAKAAIAYARKKKAVALDVCPIDTDAHLTWGEGFIGFASVFRELGFKEVARRSPKRPLMRLFFDGTAR
ncbi:GNAT family N-acetyltransferase [Nordella sp. HKS 07]|uniref:GNAT family N-acetyltransferase n=1 Tax=Nordella sp. HKS 07 TaxID=2712222 RepID=UPI0013E1150C|nr:GNAT family N-acetyltransferase [Nordella sp. HKS 07]QIG50824.1 GNAT family N-acetyltransferase [Nordella sp. HKS 07]